MPQVYQPVDEIKVKEILRARGYGIDSCPGFQFRLTVPDGGKPRAADKKQRQRAIGGPRKDDWKRITKYSENEVQAADQVERLARGEDLTGSTAGPAKNGAPDMALLGKLVDNRVGPLAAQVDRLTSLMERFLLREADQSPAALPPQEAAVPEQPEAVMGYEPESKPKRPHPGKGKTRVKVDGKWRWVPKAEASL